MGRFASDTAVARAGPGVWSARIDPGWWVQRGPNGGYIAAIVVRAMAAEVGDGGRPPRSVTIHYLAPPVEGECTVETRTERAGRSLTAVSARLVQGGRTVAVALGAFAAGRDHTVEFDDLPMPVVAPPEECPDLGAPPFPLPLRDRFECRLALGGEPFVASDAAYTGGWIRLVEGEAADDFVVAAFTDAWPPAVFSRVGRPMAVPTIDLTVHFRRPGPVPGEGWCLVAFRTVLSSGGYLEEDGHVWSPDGRLIAQSRQLAVATPLD